MANLKSIDFRDQQILLLFGSKWYRDAKIDLKFKDFDDLIKRIGEFDTEFVAKLLFYAHQNACFFKKSDPIINQSEEFYNVIDEIGLRKISEMVTEGYLDLSGYNRLSDDEKEKIQLEATKKKAMNQTEP